MEKKNNSKNLYFFGIETISSAKGDVFVIEREGEVIEKVRINERHSIGIERTTDYEKVRRR